jgi:hypothetical protein
MIMLVSSPDFHDMSGQLSKTKTSRSAVDDDNTDFLPVGFEPGSRHVICARGKAFFDHSGNQYYRKMVESAKAKYLSSKNKFEKTLVVTEILSHIIQPNPIDGGFIKKTKGGRWVVVGEAYAREKVGQSLRDTLHDQYKSSTKAKKRQRLMATERIHGSVNEVMNSNQAVSTRMEELAKEVEENGSSTDDFAICTIFTRANSDILESIKKDATLRKTFENYSE